ncbi:regucalcin-like [Haliotis rufescens]|uniref:regucalcin-like n=1 Tax=Haliotis rufescens TaxID=6454 RepID=UPI00201EA960|nr:regucalcin-like [Haliotis rufescens]XP_046330858.2 regucalcin-like [Haliotis rufescens]XP_048256078.1 regucalcin-like [Haliotis rufescens]XP_048256079.1 regucalcin-like [Haliotis rufescens]
MSYRVETVLKNVATKCGEGPHWEDSTQTLLFVDLDNGKIFRYNPVTGTNDMIQLNGCVGFVVPRSKGGLMVGLDRTFSALDWNTKTVTKMAEVDPGKSNNRMNDGKCDAKGRLWAGTMSKSLEDDQGNLYCLDTDGSVTKKVERTCISNGLAWSVDNTTMYFVDTTPRKVYAYNYDINTGNISNKRVAVDFDKVPEFKGHVPSPDGMTVDTDDNIWVACLGGGCMVKFDSRTGAALQKVSLPNATQITSAAWGGRNLDELYVTSLRKEIPDSELLTTNSLAGSLFRVTGLGVKGLPAYVYQG